MKRCNKCGDEKPLSEFHRTSRSKDGREGRCRPCRAKYNADNKDRTAEYRKKYYAENKERYSNYYAENKDRIAKRRKNYYVDNRERFLDEHRLRQYGITPDQFAAKIEQQAGRCGICRLEFTDTPSVDHDHACCPGKKSCGQCVRKLLCARCNTRIGGRENPEFRDEDEAYLSEFRAP